MYGAASVDDTFGSQIFLQYNIEQYYYQHPAIFLYQADDALETIRSTNHASYHLCPPCEDEMWHREHEHTHISLTVVDHLYAIVMTLPCCEYTRYHYNR